MRVTEAAGYRERRDSISHDWLQTLQQWEMIPLPVPNLARGAAGYVDALAPDLVVLTGGDDIGETPARDAAESEILDFAIARSIPVLGVCRGMQVINRRYGGTTVPVENHVACHHDVHFSRAWQPEYGAEGAVNSYHNQGIAPSTLGSGLDTTATDDDGGIEAFRHADLPIAGIMWHPERDGAPQGDRALFLQLMGATQDS